MGCAADRSPTPAEVSIAPSYAVVPIPCLLGVWWWSLTYPHSLFAAQTGDEGHWFCFRLGWAQYRPETSGHPRQPQDGGQSIVVCPEAAKIVFVLCEEHIHRLRHNTSGWCIREVVLYWAQLHQVFCAWGLLALGLHILLMLFRSFKAGPLDSSFWSFSTFLHHGIEKVEGHLENWIKQFEGKVGQMCHRSCSLV